MPGGGKCLPVLLGVLAAASVLVAVFLDDYHARVVAVSIAIGCVFGTLAALYASCIADMAEELAAEEAV